MPSRNLTADREAMCALAYGPGHPLPGHGLPQPGIRHLLAWLLRHRTGR